MYRSAICVTFFLSVRHARLMSYGYRIGCNAFDSLLSSYSALYLGLPTEQAEGQSIPPGMVASDTIKVQTTPVPIWPQTTLVLIGTQ